MMTRRILTTGPARPLAACGLALLLATTAPHASAASFVVSGSGDLYDAAFDADTDPDNFRVNLIYGSAGALFADTTSYVVNEDGGNAQSSVNNLLGGTLTNTNLGTNNDGGGILTRAGANISDYTATWHIDASASGLTFDTVGINGGLIGLFGAGTSRDVTWEVSTDNATWTTWLRNGDIATTGSEGAINDVSGVVTGADELYIRLTGTQVGGDWWNTQAGRSNTVPGGTALDIQIAFDYTAPPPPPAGPALLTYADFSDTSDLVFNGTAVAFDSKLRLTEATFSQAGSVFHDTRQNTEAFQTTFAFRLTDQSTDVSGADGLAFVMHNDAAGASALGSAGGDLGYFSGGSPAIDSSIAVLFGTFGTADVRIVAANASGALVGDSGWQSLGASSLFDTTDLHSVEIIYDPAFNLLSVFFDGATTAAATLTVDLDAVLGDSEAYVGFTGATGGWFQTHWIESWQYSAGLAASVPTPAALPAGLALMLAFAARRRR